MWDWTWKQICGLKLIQWSTFFQSLSSGRVGVVIPVFMDVMVCLVITFFLGAFVSQFHSLTSDTVVTDDLAAWYGLGWSSKILPRYHFVGGFWSLPKVCFWIKISLDLRRMSFSGSRREVGDSLEWR